MLLVVIVNVVAVVMLEKANTNPLTSLSPQIVGSLSASADVLALSTVEVDLGSVAEVPPTPHSSHTTSSDITTTCPW